ncbi:MAG: serine/threonine-protein kinase, partial [Thermoanaerobaculia bacterium]
MKSSDDAVPPGEEQSTETLFPGRPAGAPAPPATDSAADFERGRAIGRYVILDRVGSGGMGVVYAAYDPELDRRIALKFLRLDRAARDPEAARLRLLREAQAIARLSHPNVVSVYDAGSFGAQVFVAMELVPGRTLRQWLQEAKPSWREVLDRFRLAGRGLAAAHAAGLVHRDFKPDNVLLGEDGRVRVADFGLARPAGTAELPISESGSGGVLDSPITDWGVHLGTPAYMAPEQLQGRQADARSDQFSFCVSLYEALYGERPFPGVAAGEAVREAPAGTRVPGWLRQILLRGLRTDPAARYPSMDALLRELERDPAATRRRWLAAAAVVLVTGALFSGLGYFQARRARLCGGGEEKLAGVWDAGRKQAVHAAFLAVGTPMADAAWRTVEPMLDRYTGSWIKMRRDACEATRVRGEQSEDLLDR